MNLILPPQYRPCPANHQSEFLFFEDLEIFLFAKFSWKNDEIIQIDFRLKNKKSNKVKICEIVQGTYSTNVNFIFDTQFIPDKTLKFTDQILIHYLDKGGNSEEISHYKPSTPIKFQMGDQIIGLFSKHIDSCPKLPGHDIPISTPDTKKGSIIIGT